MDAPNRDELAYSLVIAAIFTLSVCFFLYVFWVAPLESKIRVLERKIEALEIVKHPR